MLLQSGSLVVANEEGELQELNPIRDVFRENRSQAAPDRDEQRKALWRRFKVEDYDPDLVPSGLSCAFSLLLLLDAVTVPCCRRTVSRKVATELLPEKGYICPSCAKRVSIDGLEECPELQNKAKRWLEEQKEVAQRQTTNSHNAGHSEQGEEEFSPEPGMCQDLACLPSTVRYCFSSLGAVENDIYALLGGPSPYENTKQDSTAENPVTESNEAKVTVKQNDLRTDYTTTTSASLSVPSGSSTGSGTNVTSATTHSTGSTQGNSLLPYPYHARPPIRPPPRGYPWGGRPMYHPEMQRPIYPRHPYDMYGGGYMYAQPPFMPPRAPIRPSMQPNASSAYYHASSGGSDNSRRNSGRCSRSRSRSNSRPNNRGSESHRSSRSRSREHSRHSSSNIRSESRSQSRQGSENSGGRSNRGRGGGRGRSRGNRNKGKKHSDDGGRMISHKLDRSS